MTTTELLLLSDIAKASAALLIVSTTIPAPDDRRSHLIREMVNSGMDDDGAVEFLALLGMPIDLLEETQKYLSLGVKRARGFRRQNFFRFANDMFHDLLVPDAITAVRNGMLIAPKSSDQFVPYMTERATYLRDHHDIDLTRELTAKELVAARALMAVMAEPLSKYDGADDYGIVRDDELALLVIEVGDRYPELICHIGERGSLDVELLRSLMRATAPAVSKGIL